MQLVLYDPAILHQIQALHHTLEGPRSPSLSFLKLVAPQITVTKRHQFGKIWQIQN